MELQVTGTNVEVPERVRSYAEKKIGKLTRFWPNILEAKVEISEEKTKTPDKRILIRVNIDGEGAGFHGVARAPEEMSAIDKVTEVMVRQVESYKGKMIKKARNTALKEGTTEEVEPASEPETPRLVKVKSFQVKPASIDEAIEQMEVLGHDFYLFVDAETEEIKLIYRRRDGNYGLIEPQVKLRKSK